MKLHEIRQKFLDYFTNLNHTVVPSSPLIPANDPTLLFTNAGMVQFKEVFLGLDKREYNKAVSVQKCLRAGGKHNDLDNVGYTARHHTFFEMLGNFSFGDYFKEEAIDFAWKFLTEELKIPKEKLWVTVHHSDQESEDIWINQINFPKERIAKCDEDNFWSMGDTGPCGTSTEIFYDHGDKYQGNPPGHGDEGDRFVEIWNLVFMQYDRDIDGNMNKLPMTCIDTGMGLERITAVMQGVNNNYEIDFFKALISKISSIISEVNKNLDLNSPSLKVIADHIRSSAFLIADGVIPSNEGRGYVLRRIIRRALRHGHKLGMRKPFFYRLVDTLASLMGNVYKELIDSFKIIEEVLLKEEEQFLKTLDQGMVVLDKYIQEIKQNNVNVLAGHMTFKLYDTYGFPVDLTFDIAREQDLLIDESGFQKEMEQQKELARSSSQFNKVYEKGLDLGKLSDTATKFIGYDNSYKKLSHKVNILGLYKLTDKDNIEQVSTLELEQSGLLITDKTPFYAESGGQVGDKGYFIKDQDNKIKVLDVFKVKKVFVHKVLIKTGNINVDDVVLAEVDIDLRAATARNHSATHLLHAALRDILGNFVKQRGSYVGPDYLRFDFSYHKSISAIDLQKITNKVNKLILDNTQVSTDIMSMEQAQDKGAMALFGEKYDKDVRVLTMADTYSKELCGGTHVSATGDIGAFFIISESSVATGVRRIEAITGIKAIQEFLDKQQKLNEISGLLSCDINNISKKIEGLQDKQKLLEKELKSLKSKLANQSSDDLLNQVTKVGDINVLTAIIKDTEGSNLRNLIDNLKTKFDKAVIVLAVVENNKISLVAGVTKNCTKELHAGNLIKILAEKVDGRGGGRPDFASGGGQNILALDSALLGVKDWVANSIA
tara:strand:+ start:9206 stop:11863 length:2658 start_codon:yes stop_codon:yes gene_type:complete